MYLSLDAAECDLNAAECTASGRRNGGHSGDTPLEAGADLASCSAGGGGRLAYDAVLVASKESAV